MTIIAEIDDSYSMLSEADGSQESVDGKRSQYFRRLIQALFIGCLFTAGACEQYLSSVNASKSPRHSLLTETKNPAGYVGGELVRYVLAGSENDPNAQLCKGKIVRPIFDQNGILMGYLVDRDGIGQDIVTQSQIR